MGNCKSWRPPTGCGASGLQIQEGVEELSSRVNLGSLKSEAALLKTFLLLRVRYQEISRLEAHRHHEAALDSLYLLGDVFTVPYPVRAQPELRGETITLILRGEPQRAPGDGAGTGKATSLPRPLPSVP